MLLQIAIVTYWHLIHILQDASTSKLFYSTAGLQRPILTGSLNLDCSGGHSSGLVSMQRYFTLSCKNLFAERLN